MFLVFFLLFLKSPASNNFAFPPLSPPPRVKVFIDAVAEGPDAVASAEVAALRAKAKERRREAAERQRAKAMQALAAKAGRPLPGGSFGTNKQTDYE